MSIIFEREPATISQVFIQEMTIIAGKDHGYISDCVGYVVIVYFPIIDDNFSLDSNNAISSALNMQFIMETHLYSKSLAFLVSRVTSIYVQERMQ